MQEGTFIAQEKSYYKMVAQFKMSKKRNYDFLTKAGPGFENVVLTFYQRMFAEEQFPSDFQNTTLHKIYEAVH